MINLMLDSAEAVSQHGHRMLHDMHGLYHSFEDTAQAVCESIIDNFEDNHGEPGFALVRIFRLGTPEEVPPELQQYLENPTPTVLVLAGTAGIEAPWNERHNSATHQVVYVDDNMSPMFKAVFREAGIETDIAGSFDEYEVDAFSRYFHVENAAGNPAIPAQSEFVEPFGIQSMIAFGGRFLSGASYVTVGFSRQKLDEAAAKRFAYISPYLSTLLAAYEGRGSLWNHA